MNTSETIMDLAAALVKAMPVVKTAKMDCTNPFFKSKYADLSAVWDAVREALKDNGLTVAQFPDQTMTGEPALTTVLLHGSGEWISGTYPLCVTDKESTPQGYGSAMTYARRYGLSAVLGVIADEDDDGNAASARAKPATSLKPQPAPTPSPPMTPEQWMQKAVTIILAASKAELDAFTNKHADKIAKYRIPFPALHAEIIKAIQHRQTELNP